MIYDMMVYLTAIWLTPGGSSTLLHTNNTWTTQSTQNNTQNNTINTWNNIIKEECGPCPVFARYTLAFALQLRKKHGKTSVRIEIETPTWMLYVKIIIFYNQSHLLPPRAVKLSLVSYSELTYCWHKQPNLIKMLLHSCHSLLLSSRNRCTYITLPA